MRSILSKSLLWAAIFLPLAKVSAKSPDTHTQLSHYGHCLSKAPLLFTPNQGQVADINGRKRPDILFTATNADTKLFLSANGISYQFTRSSAPAKKLELIDNNITSTCGFRMELAGANKHPEILRGEPGKVVENFYGTAYPQGITGVSTYSRLVYKDVYPGVNWVVYNKGNRLEYDFEIKSGADLSRIRMKIKDAGSVNIAADGSLVIKTDLGEVRQHAPVSYINGHSVSSHFRKYADGSIGFAAAKPRVGETLVIDPSVDWETYYGGSLYELGNYVAVSDSSVYLIGRSPSTSGIATTGAFQTTYGGGGDDAMIVKFDTLGNLLWATYYGGSASADFGYGCAIDSTGYLYFIGLSQSSGLSTAGTYQAAPAGIVDAMLVKFNSVTGARIWATYFGGTGNDQGMSCALNGGNIYIAGITNSTVGIASPGAFQDTLGRVATSTVAPTYDGFLARFDTSGSLIWSTYYGGSGSEGNSTTAVDANGYVYLSGFTTSSSGISAPGAFQPVSGGGYDIYLVKFDSLGNRIWATYYGGGGTDQAALGDGMVITGGNIYIAGQTTSSSGVATAGSYQSTIGGGTYDALLVKFDTSGNRLWATYYGGDSVDYGTGCALDGYGNEYLVGYTRSSAGIASALGFQTTYGGGYFDGYAAKFDSLGTRIWGSYCGGNDTDYLQGCASDHAGHLYLVGYTKSATGIASPTAYQDTNAGSYDAYLTRVNDPVGPTKVAGAVRTNESMLGQNYPNPFSGSTTIPFYTQGGTISLQLFDINGRFLKTLAQGYYKAGNYTVLVNRDALLPGNYLYKISDGKTTATKQMLVTGE